MKKYKLGNKKHLFFVLIFSLISSLILMINSFAIKNITDAALASDLSKVISIVKVLLLVILIRFIIRLLAIRIEESYISVSSQEFKNAYINRLLDKNLLSINKVSDGTYTSQLTNDMDRYQEIYYKNIIKVVSVLSQVVTGMLILLIVEAKLLIASFIIILVSVYIAKQSSQSVKSFEKKKTQSLNLYTSKIQETLLGFYVIKEGGMETKQKEKFSEVAKLVQDDNRKLDLKTSRVDALTSSIHLLFTMSLFLLGVLAAKFYGLSAGTAMLIGFAFADTSWPIQQLIPYLSQMNGIQSVLDSFDEALSSETYKTPNRISGIAEIEYKNVSLGYDETVILDEINFKINSNQKVLILGKSGSGKSTLLKSMRRQIKEMSGEILVNGFKLESINPYDYFSDFAVVDQIGFIFNGSLEENISLNRPKKVDIGALLNEVGLAKLNPKMELLNNGANVSGGQRARIMLARALYLEASVIVCDEILASLDQEVARTIERDILEQDTSVINVSHIYFPENYHLYDIVLQVKDGKVIKLS